MRNTDNIEKLHNKNIKELIVHNYITCPLKFIGILLSKEMKLRNQQY
jgi:hypothetical protein